MITSEGLYSLETLFESVKSTYVQKKTSSLFSATDISGGALMFTMKGKFATKFINSVQQVQASVQCVFEEKVAIVVNNWCVSRWI